MDRFSEQLQQHMEIVKQIGDRIEPGESYMEDIRGYLPELNQMMTIIFQLIQTTDVLPELNQEYVVQVLNDILYGMENRDSVFLLDVFRYGLLEIYKYIQQELQSEGAR